MLHWYFNQTMHFSTMDSSSAQAWLGILKLKKVGDHCPGLVIHTGSLDDTLSQSQVAWRVRCLYIYPSCLGYLHDCILANIIPGLKCMCGANMLCMLSAPYSTYLASSLPPTLNNSSITLFGFHVYLLPTLTLHIFVAVPHLYSDTTALKAAQGVIYFKVIPQQRPE